VKSKNQELVKFVLARERATLNGLRNGVTARQLATREDLLEIVDILDGYSTPF